MPTRCWRHQRRSCLRRIEHSAARRGLGARSVLSDALTCRCADVSTRRRASPMPPTAGVTSRGTVRATTPCFRPRVAGIRGSDPVRHHPETCEDQHDARKEDSDGRGWCPTRRSRGTRGRACGVGHDRRFSAPSSEGARSGQRHVSALRRVAAPGSAWTARPATERLGRVPGARTASTVRKAGRCCSSYATPGA